MIRPLLALALALVLAAPAGTASAPEDMALVREALGVVRTRHWNPNLDIPALARAGVGGLRRPLQRAGVDAAAIPDVPAGLDESRTLAAFGDRFDQAVRLAGGRADRRLLVYGALRAMLGAVGGSHTYFLSPRDRALDEAAARGLPYVGIGLSFADADGTTVISRVVRGGPADLAGVRRGDAMLRVDGVPIEGLDPSEIRSLVLGDAGTTVTLGLRRGGREFAVSIVRGPVALPVVESRMLPGRIAYLKLYGYPLESSSRIKEELARLLTTDPRGLIVDLRENSGGFIREFVDTAGLFLPPGTVVGQEFRRDGRLRRMVTGGIPIVPAIPIVALIDLGTGSAGELTAAALRERANAVLVGGRTGGALETGILVGLSDGSGVNIAIARTLTGTGVEIEGRGYAPDIEVRNDPESERDAQLERALRVFLQRASGLARAA